MKFTANVTMTDTKTLSENKSNEAKAHELLSQAVMLLSKNNKNNDILNDATKFLKEVKA